MFGKNPPRSAGVWHSALQLFNISVFHKWVLPALLLVLSGAASAATIWQEDFNSYSDGTTNGPAGKWSVDISDCSFDTSGDDHFEVRSQQMQGNDLDGVAVWTSEPISISGQGTISVSVSISDVDQGLESSDYIRLYYTLDGGSETLFDTNGDNSGNFGDLTASQSGLSGSSLQLIVKVINGANTEYISFDDVIVSGDGTPPANSAPVLAAIGNQSTTVSNTLNFSVTATDADNDLVILSASNLPPDAVFNTVTNTGSVTGQFIWAVAEPVGIYTSQFYAADGTTNVFEEITITVTNPPVVNVPPVLNPIGNKSLTVSNALSFAVSAIDANNDLVTLTASNLPPGAVFVSAASNGTVSSTFNWAVAEPSGIYTSQFYAADGTTNVFEEITIAVTNPPPAPPLTGAVWNVMYNLPYQSGAANDYPGQFVIRNGLVDRINALENGNSATLATFTFSAEEGAGAILTAIEAALDRGAAISFIADGDINIATDYGAANSLFDLAFRAVNPLDLVVDGSSSGIMHDKLGLFDYGGTNQWVFTASWNFTLAASADQWNIAFEARSPALYTIYMNETAELLAGRFHDDPAKSHAHDGSTFILDGSWGTNVVRFAPYPDDTPGGNNAESDIIALIDQAQSNIIFALNKLNRPLIRDALIAAANRGVAIQGVMPRSDTDPGGVSATIYNSLTNHIEFLPAYAEADYSALDNGEPNLIHAKYMVIDSGSANAIVIHGSANWTSEALVNDNDNDENVIFLRHNEIAEQFYTHFERITGTGAYSEGNSTLVSWDFEDDNQIADGGITANENQTVVRVPAPSSYSYTANALSCSGWKDGAGTTYWETSFATTDHADIKASSVQLASSTGPADFKLQYKIGAAGTYTEVPYSDVHVPDGGNGVLTRVLLPTECENQAEVFLRWLLTSNFRADGSTAIGSTGAGRIDDIIITGTAYDQPPILDPIGDLGVFETESVSFTVTASDPIDNDPVTLSVSNLPTGATFINGLFNWSSAVPVGAYHVTFTATDKDGSDSEIVTITVTEKLILLISEVADPDVSSAEDYRFVELYNAGTNSIDLATGNWYLSKQVNEGTSWSDIPLSGTVPADATWVIATSEVEFQAAYGFAPDQATTSVGGNGDDAYFLFYGGDHETGILIDVYGEFDTDGSGTAWEYTDGRAERNKDILNPNTAWAAPEWTITAGATTNDMTPGVHGPAPEFENLSDEFVFLGDNLSLTVTAVNNVRPDVISLSATALPGTASFPPATGTDRVSSLLSWAAPPEGTYTATFNAAGASGTTTESITITVSPTSQIDGWFYGWKYGTIVKLTNGQFWRNIGGAGTQSFDPPLNRPNVSVTNPFGTRQMNVDGVNRYTEVERIEINESTVINDFSGLQNGNVYELSDGTRWEQLASSDNGSSSADPVTAWRWTENGNTYLRFLDRDDVVIGTCEVAPAAPPSNEPITSRIVSWFRGYQNKRVFALENGQFWQQVSLDSSVETLYRPDVTIINWLQSGTWRMTVTGAATPPSYIEVRQLTNVTRTSIDGWFYGFGLDEIFHLTDGSWWKQTSLDTSASTRNNPEILIWSENGTDYLEMPDEGRTVAGEQLTVMAESSMTGPFNGLHYAKIYELANGQDWLQISFENISSSMINPAVMLWAETGTTNLLARDSSDRKIGSCTVVDPWADDDNDLMPNASEIIAGTSLYDQNDFFLITDIQYDNQGRAILSWAAVSGRIYTVEWTPALNQPFQPLETDIEWPQNSWTDVYNASGIGGFYRIRVRLTE